MEIISSYTRQEAIDDHVLIDIKAPIFNNSEFLFKMLGHNHSICITDTLLAELIEYTDETISIEDQLKAVMYQFVDTVTELKKDPDSKVGNELKFYVALMTEKISHRIKIKSITHLENNFGGHEKAKCITIMKEFES